MPTSRFHATPERATGLAASRRKFSVSDHRSATSFRWATSGLSQPEGLQGIRGRASRIRLECLVDIRNLTRPAERDATKGTAHDTKMICDDSRTVRLSCPVWVQKATYSPLSHRRPTEIGSKLEPPQRDVPKSCSISNGGVGAYGGPPYNRNLSSEHPHSCVPTRGRHET
jgi:hypothetical protein